MDIRAGLHGPAFYEILGYTKGELNITSDSVKIQNPPIPPDKGVKRKALKNTQKLAYRD